MQGGDLMDAVAADSKNLLRWSRKGHILAMDIAKGLVHLHANKVLMHTCPMLTCLLLTPCLKTLTLGMGSESACTFF